MQPVYVGRQPIFDRTETIIGFELLFRGDNTESASVSDGDAATDELLRAAMVDIGIDRLVGEHLAFLNVPRQFLYHPILRSLPAQQIVFELLPEILIDQELATQLETLRAEGYRIVLDSRHFKTAPEYAPGFADLVKIDVIHYTPAELETLKRQLEPDCGALIAAKIEDAATYQRCLELGFQGFQGFYLSYPNVVEGQRLNANQVTLLQLLELLQRDTSGLDEMANLVLHDPGLSVEMLKLVNSPRFRRAVPIESIKQAIQLLGRAEIGRWALLLSLRASNSVRHHAMEQALIRAQMAQSLTAICDQEVNRDRLFTLGLLSVVDRLLQVPLTRILREMNLSQDLTQALIDRDGALALVLEILDACEQPDTPLPDPLAISPQAIGQLYLEAMQWARTTLDQFATS